MLVPVLFAQHPQLSVPEQRTQATIERSGGKFDWIKEDDGWKFCLDVDSSKKRFQFTSLRGLERLNVLRVFRGEIDEDSLAHLQNFKRLELLIILSDGVHRQGL